MHIIPYNQNVDDEWIEAITEITERGPRYGDYMC